MSGSIITSAVMTHSAVYMSHDPGPCAATVMIYWSPHVPCAAPPPQEGRPKLVGRPLWTEEARGSHVRLGIPETPPEPCRVPLFRRAPHGGALQRGSDRHVILAVSQAGAAATEKRAGAAHARNFARTG